MKDFLMDDKNLVILAVVILGVSVIFSGVLDPDKVNLLTSAFSGLFGIAVGRAGK